MALPDARQTKLCQVTGTATKIGNILFKEPEAPIEKSPLDSPQECKHEKKHRRSALAHGVEAEGDQHQRVVGQADVQPR